MKKIGPNLLIICSKPIKFDRFFKAIQKAQEYIRLRESDSSELSDFTQEYVYIKTDRKYVRLYYKDISHIQGMKDYVMIHTENSKYMTAMNIKTILKQLPDEIFSRVSKSYIVNINKIESIDTDMIYFGDTEIPLGNAYRETFLERHIKVKLLKR
jgi:DNA-binding LytR/AlgR family response regulator